MEESPEGTSEKGVRPGKCRQTCRWQAEGQMSGGWTHERVTRPAYFTLVGHDVENSHHGAQPNSAAGPCTEALQLQHILQTFALESDSSWEHALRGEEHGFISEQLKKSSPELGIGKMKTLRRLAGSAAALALLSPVSAASAYAAMNSQANVGLPTNEIVTVCPGVSYNSHTDAEGARLSQQQLAGLVRHMKSICRWPAGWESSAHAHAAKAPRRPVLELRPHRCPTPHWAATSAHSSI